MTAWGSVTDLLGDDLDDIEFLGRGSSGSVYRATQRSLGRTVAVKVFRRFADDETDRVMAEARAQATLSWHANVVSLYSQGVTPDGFPYLIMEYAPGGSLADRIDQRGPMAEDEWRRMGSEVASALAAAHDAGVVHCDVKPSNILFAADGSARLADFGIAKATGMTSGTIDSIQGSLAYVPPELLDGEKPQPANDVYSLALTVGFAVSGLPPLPDGIGLPELVARIQSGLVGQQSLRRTDLGSVRDLLASACSTYARDRPAMREMALDLEPEMRGGRGEVQADGRVSKAHLGLAALAVLLVSGMLGTLFVAARLTRPSPAPPPDLCSEYDEYLEGRRDLFTEVSSRLEQSGSPTAVIEELLVGFPREFAEIAAPFIRTSVVLGGTTGEFTRAQLSALALAENLRSLNGGKGFLYDGEGGAFDPSGLPAELLLPGQMFSEANAFAEDQCPDVSTDLAPGKARMRSAIYSNLTDPDFMDDFFSDPRSMELFDAELSVLVPTFAWQIFRGLLTDHWDWYVALLSERDVIRQAILQEHPHSVLEAAASSPEVLEAVRTAGWLEELQVGVQRSSEPERAGMHSMYGDTMRELGLEP